VTHKTPDETFVRRRNDRLTRKQRAKHAHRPQTLIQKQRSPHNDRKMKRLILTFLAGISLLLGVSASIGSQATPAQAETTIPLYGCPATLDGSPIGGGVGYLNTIDPSQADYVVSTAAALKSALAAATSGQIVYVADGATCAYTSTTTDWYKTSGYESVNELVHVPDGVTLAAGRGRAGVTPGCLQLGESLNSGGARNFITVGAGAKLIGLDLFGPEESEAGNNAWRGVMTAYGTSSAANEAEIANCEIHGFGHAGVYIRGASGVTVHHNYIHHNRGAKTGNLLGYGVCIQGTSGATVKPIIEGNYFDYNRHSTAGVGGQSINYPGHLMYADYEIRYNLFGSYAATGGGSQVDQHGGTGNVQAGGTWSIHHNTSIAQQTSFSGNNPFILIRGIPVIKGEIYNNWTYYLESDCWAYLSANWGYYRAICEIMCNITAYQHNAPYGTQSSASAGPYVWVNIYCHDNWYGTTPPPTTNVAPVLNAIGNKSIKEGATLSFAISGSDANGDALAYSASNLPVGATFNSTNRTFSWTPGLGQAGVYAGVHFQVSDGQVTDYEDITITVTVIDEVAPVLNAIGDKGINWGATLSFTISGSDANGDALTYSASNLPVGATFDPATQTFSWTPEDVQAGVYASIRFQVSDGSLSDTEDITITVSGGVLADVNSDGAVNSLDMIRVGQHWNETGESGWIPEDINKDGTVNVLDATLVGQHWTG